MNHVVIYFLCEPTPRKGDILPAGYRGHGGPALPWAGVVTGVSFRQYSDEQEYAITVQQLDQHPTKESK